MVGFWRNDSFIYPIIYTYLYPGTSFVVLFKDHIERIVQFCIFFQRMVSGYMLFMIEKLKAAKGNHPEVMKISGNNIINTQSGVSFQT